jgi:E3 ubiquitin-protein ligase UBR2
VYDSRVTCILCQESELINSSGKEYKPVVMAALVQQSTVLNRHRSSFLDDHELNVDGKVQTTPCISHNSLCLKSNLGPAPHISSCGHMMHQTCFDNFFESVRRKEEQRAVRRDQTSFDVKNKEYPCPLCYSLSNCTLPIFEENSEIIDRCTVQKSVDSNDSLEEWFNVYEVIYSRVVSLI